MKRKGENRAFGDDAGGRRTIVPPYDALAAIYDRVMRHVDYEGWTMHTLSLLNEHGLPNPGIRRKVRLLECACGTGNVALRLAQAGYRVDAFDYSASMLEVAKARGERLEHSPHFFQSDFLHFSSEVRFDGALCLYDSINYLTDLQEVVAFLLRVKQTLKRGAPFIFDVCTEHNSRIHFNGRLEKIELEDCVYTRSMHYDTVTRRQSNRFEIVFADKPEVIHVEEHRQQIYSLEQIIDGIGRAGMRILSQTAEFSRKPPTETSLRVHFVVAGG